MGLLNLLWQPSEQFKCYLHGLEYDQQKLDVTLKLDIDAEASTQPLKFVLIERQTRKRITTKVDSELDQQSSDLIQFSLDITGNVNELTSGIWDAYFHVNLQGKEKVLRVKNSLTNTLEYPPLYINRINKSLIPYSTVKGNLSFKSDISTAKLVSETVNLDTFGVLKISGYFLVPSWQVSESKEVKKTILLTRKNGTTLELPAKHVNRPDISKHYGQPDGTYDWTGYEIELDFKKDNLLIHYDEAFEIAMRMEYQDKVISMPLNVDASKVFNDSATFHTSGIVNKVMLNVGQIDNTLSVLVTREDFQAEIRAVYARNGEITLHGQVMTSLDASAYTNHACIRFEKRGTDISHEYGISVEDRTFTYTINIEESYRQGLFSDGIWDLYFISDVCKSKLVSRLDDISSKQKLVNLPQQTFINRDRHIKVIKPYYTIHEEVSILVRDYIQTKSIDNVRIVKSDLLITGKLNIQPPHKELPKVLEGSILIKGQYGAKYHLPVEWELQKTGKTTLEHAFVAKIKLDHEEKIKKMQLLRDINFDLIRCHLNFDDALIPFTMNVDASKVVMTFEDRLKQRTKLKTLINKSLLPFYKACNKVLPINNKVIVFQSFHGKSYSCNPKAIYEELVDSKKNYKSVWVINNLNTEIPGNPIKVRPHSLKYYYYMAVGKFFVNNGNFPDFYEKRNGAVHLQTWHGTPLKKLGFDIDPTSESYAENTSPALLERNKRWDYLIGPNDYTSTILKRAFAFNKTTLDIGYPRNDVLLKRNKEDKLRAIKKKLNIPDDKKVMLYAPTWRDYEFHNGANFQPYQFKFDLERMREKFGNEYVLLVRLHYRDAMRIQLEGYEDFVYNVSSYDDIQELYLISNLLITDYSSVMFDYANLNRPMIFFAYDMPRYATQVRGFYFDFQKEAPGPIVISEEKLFHAIDNIDRIQQTYRKKYKDFTSKFCHLDDGKAARRTIEEVLG
ncbi:CDP-glycerol glycerophosphotransferase family protein [Bacillus sp. N1-1]|uniref:CDP-glycerol glycerophosphotransferase family protein n=1 Tax=Bacillus sp. N1-1 TaxID=2682541 RepID=UPI001316F520|nr:CDP-glycerol glycerophosphotransferase family protein [Bacillus sp. N1-1]QHA93640.1 CDP-glycerol glycerophosphotransferase family protein [Bacillus sp. N1-1]